MIGIDLGSNTLRIVEYDAVAQTFTKRFERMVKTADGLIQTGEISLGAIERIIETLTTAKTFFDFSHGKYKAVATAALRMATNAQAVLHRIEAQTGIRFEVIDAKQEALFTLRAVAYRLERLKMGVKNYAVLDVGGASTELIVSMNGSHTDISVNVGIVTLSQQPFDRQARRAFLLESFKPFQALLAQHPVETVIATSGTPTTMAAMKHRMALNDYDPERINGTKLDRSDLITGLQTLLSWPMHQREAYVGVGRSDLIEVGVDILIVMLECLNRNEMVVIDDSLREGVALEGALEGGF